MACVSSTLTYRTKNRLEFQSVFLYPFVQTRIIRVCTRLRVGARNDDKAGARNDDRVGARNDVSCHPDLPCHPGPDPGSNSLVWTKIRSGIQDQP